MVCLRAKGDKIWFR